MKHVVAVVAYLMVVTGCSSSSACGCGLSVDAYMSMMVGSATTVVVAELVEDGAEGEVVIRPIIWLKGTLPLDADGLYRFDWDQVTDQRTAVWLFGSEGHPWWGTDFSEAEGEDWPEEGYIPELPWSMKDFDGSLAVGTHFPDAIAAEVRRILSTADLLVEVELVGSSASAAQDGMAAMRVRQVLAGVNRVEVGDTITVTYSEFGQPGRNAGLPMVWALQDVDGDWVTVETWWRGGWTCSFGPDLEIDVVRTDFPSFVPTCPA